MLIETNPVMILGFNSWAIPVSHGVEFSMTLGKLGCLKRWSH
jgi:hypothetical protein